MRREKITAAVIFLAFALPLAVLAASYNTESNEVEVDVVNGSPVSLDNANANANGNVNVNSNDNDNANTNDNDNANTNANENANVNAPVNANANTNAPAARPRPRRPATPPANAAPPPANAPPPQPPSVTSPGTPPENTPSPGQSAGAAPPPAEIESPSILRAAGLFVDAFSASAQSVAVKVAPYVDKAIAVVQKQVLENPRVQQAANVAVAPAATVATAAVATSLDLALILQYLSFILTQPLAFLDRRRAKRSGSVVNAFTKLPIDLAVVRLMDAATGRIVRTRLTDRQGRFIFFAPPGTYRIEAAKPGFALHAAGAGLYAGGNISPENGFMAPQIALAPVDVDKRAFALDAAKALRVFKHGVALASTVFAGAAFVESINPWTGANLVAQILLVLLIERLIVVKTAAHPGTVNGPGGKPVKAVVRLFETTYDKLVETAVTDESGAFAFLVGSGKYYVTAEAPKCAPFKTEVFDLSAGDKEAVIAPKIGLKAAETQMA